MAGYLEKDLFNGWNATTAAASCFSEIGDLLNGRQVIGANGRFDFQVRDVKAGANNISFLDRRAALAPCRFYNNVWPLPMLPDP